jgi:hypothetical protein
LAEDWALGALPIKEIRSRIAVERRATTARVLVRARGRALAAPASAGAVAEDLGGEGAPAVEEVSVGRVGVEAAVAPVDRAAPEREDRMEAR